MIASAFCFRHLGSILSLATQKTCNEEIESHNSENVESCLLRVGRVYPVIGSQDTFAVATSPLLLQHLLPRNGFFPSASSLRLAAGACNFEGKYSATVSYSHLKCSCSASEFLISQALVA